jgi:hypothetical protein
MGLYERLREESRRKGIVPWASQQHSRHLKCENCGEQIDPRYQGVTGRYVSEGEAKAYGLDEEIPVYAHTRCPEDGE